MDYKEPPRNDNGENSADTTPPPPAQQPPTYMNLPPKPYEQAPPVRGRASETNRLTSVARGLLKSASVTVIFVFGVIGVAAMLNAYVFQSYYVEGKSMAPTLQDSDRLVVSKVERTVSDAQQHSYIPERGQIVILDHTVSTLTTVEDEELIKRVIGLPGDRIRIENGDVIVYNAEYPDGFNVDVLLGLQLDKTFSEEISADYSVADNEVFVMGDNRGPGGSYDSRAFGPVSTDKIVGRLWLRVLPLEKSGVF